jgi:hypothetical protein
MVLVGCAPPKFTAPIHDAKVGLGYSPVTPPPIPKTQPPRGTQFTIVAFQFSCPIFSEKKAIHSFFSSWQTATFEINFPPNEKQKINKTRPASLSSVKK